MLSKRSLVSTTSAKSLVLASLATVSASFLAAAPANAQAVCVTLPGGAIDCTGIDLAGTVGAGLDLTVPGPVSVTLQDGFNSTGAIDVTTTAGAIDLVSAGTAQINTAGPGLTLDSATDIDANLTGVSTTADAATAVLLTAGDAVTFAANGTIRTAGDAADAVVATAASAALDLGTVATAGLDAYGVVATTLAGPLAVDAGTVTTAGADSNGLVLNSAEDLILNAGTVRTAGAGADAVVATAASATLDLGTVATTGVNADGVVATTLAGPLAVDATTVTTAAADSTGLLLRSREDLALTAGTVRTTGANALGVDIAAPGAVTADLGTVDTTGAGAVAVAIDAAAEPVNLRFANIVTRGANAAGVDIAADGVINVNGGNVSTAGAASTGVAVDGAAGPAAVTTGTIVTAGLDSNGIDVATTTGNQTISAGAVSTTGAGADGIVATSVDGNIAIAARGNVNAAQGTGIVADTGGTLDLTTAANTTVTGALAGIDAAAGTGSTFRIGGVLGAANGLALNADGGPATVVVAPTGRINGRVDLTAGADTLLNNGTFAAVGNSDFGAGLDVLTNNGNLSANGAVTFAGLETLNNNGLITMADGVADDVLTVPGAYNAGAGARLALDVNGGANGIVADRLVVGGTTSGTTVVELNPLGGGGVLDLDGAVIVDANGGTGTFVLASPVTAGFVDYDLGRNAAGDTIVLGTANDRAVEMAMLPQLGQGFWYRSADAWESAAAQRRNDLLTGNGRSFGVWGQVYGTQEDRGDRRDVDVFGTTRNVDLRYETEAQGAQGGFDFRPGNGNFVVGVTGGYQKAESDFNSGTQAELKGWNAGAYMIYGAPQGFYAQLLGKYDDFEVELENGTLFTGAEIDGKAYGVDGEVGYRTTIAGANFDLGAGLAYVRTDLDGFAASNAVFEVDDSDSLRGQVGFRLSGQSGAFTPYADVRLRHEFLGDGDVRFVSGGYTLPLEDRGIGTSVRAEIGVSGPSSVGGLYLAGWGEMGDTNSIGLRAGFRF